MKPIIIAVTLTLLVLVSAKSIENEDQENFPLSNDNDTEIDADLKDLELVDEIPVDLKEVSQLIQSKDFRNIYQIGTTEPGMYGDYVIIPFNNTKANLSDSDEIPPLGPFIVRVTVLRFSDELLAEYKEIDPEDEVKGIQGQGQQIQQKNQSETQEQEKFGAKEQKGSESEAKESNVTKGGQEMDGQTRQAVNGTEIKENGPSVNVSGVNAKNLPQVRRKWHQKVTTTTPMTNLEESEIADPVVPKIISNEVRRPKIVIPREVKPKDPEEDHWTIRFLSWFTIVLYLSLMVTFFVFVSVNCCCVNIRAFFRRFLRKEDERIYELTVRNQTQSHPFFNIHSFKRRSAYEPI